MSISVYESYLAAESPLAQGRELKLQEAETITGMGWSPLAQGRELK